MKVDQPLNLPVGGISRASSLSSNSSKKSNGSARSTGSTRSRPGRNNDFLEHFNPDDYDDDDWAQLPVFEENGNSNESFPNSLENEEPLPGTSPGNEGVNAWPDLQDEGRKGW